MDGLLAIRTTVALNTLTVACFAGGREGGGGRVLGKGIIQMQQPLAMGILACALELYFAHQLKDGWK